MIKLMLKFETEFTNLNCKTDVKSALFDGITFNSNHRKQQHGYDYNEYNASLSIYHQDQR